MSLPSILSSKRRPQTWDPVSVDSADACCICFHAYGASTTDGDAELPVGLPCGHVFGDAVESKCYLDNQTQQQLRGSQLWKEQVASKQSILVLHPTLE
jgi:hypothetical protein